MMFEAEAMEFPSFATLPKREKSKLQKIWDSFRELSKLTEEKGMLVPQACAARLLDVSAQRVGQLVTAGKLEAFPFQGVPYVSEKSIVAYAQSERKAGRPWPLPKTQKEAFNRAMKNKA